MSRPSKLRLILADDHPVLREGLSLILGPLPDMAVDMAFADYRPSSAVNQKHEPWSGVLSTPIRPPMRSASCRQMASPSPVPPYLRVVELSACTNAWNS